MYREWQNGAIQAGRLLVIGPRCYGVALSWNNIERIAGWQVPEGEMRAADTLIVWWRWPRFRGVNVERYKMGWREFWKL
jgi:hypothetical protein